MLPSDMNLNIRSGTVGYNNKILVSDGTFSLGKNDKDNTLELTKEGDKPKLSHINAVVQPTITHKNLARKHIHEEKKLPWYSFSLDALLSGLCLDKQVIATGRISDFEYRGSHIIYFNQFTTKHIAQSRIQFSVYQSQPYH